MTNNRMAGSSPEVNGLYLHKSTETNGSNQLTFYEADDHIQRRISFALMDSGIIGQITNVLLAETGFNLKSNGAILGALEGLGKNKLDWDNREIKPFKASRATIAKQLFRFKPDMQQNEVESNKQIVDRYLARLFKHQAVVGIEWVRKDLGPFNRKTKKNETSTFVLAYQEYVAEALYRALLNPVRYSSSEPGSKWERAAREVAEEWKAKLKNEKLGRSRTKKAQSAYHAEAAARGMLRRYAKMQATKYGIENARHELQHIVLSIIDDIAQELDTEQSTEHQSGGVSFDPPNSLAPVGSVLTIAA
jgi:hypothetical protein